MRILVLMTCWWLFLPFLFWWRRWSLFNWRFIWIVWTRRWLVPFLFLISIILLYRSWTIIYVIGYFLTTYSFLLSNLMIIEFHQIWEIFDNNLTIIFDLKIESYYTWAHGLSWSHNTFRDGNFIRYLIYLRSTILFFLKYNS